MTSIDLDNYILEEESETSPPMSLFQHLYQSPPAGAAVAPPPPARLPAASTTDDDEQQGPRFKDQARPDLLQPATVPSAIREEPTIPFASALLVPESQIEREHRVQSEMERQLDLERQQLEIERQRLELVERQQMVQLRQQQQLREKQELETKERKELERQLRVQQLIREQEQQDRQQQEQQELERQQQERQQQEWQELERQRQQQDPHQNEQSVSKKRWIGGMVLVVVLVVLVAGVAGFCGTGNCRGSSPSPSTSATEGTSPTMATAMPVSTSPSIITLEGPFPNQTNVPSASVAPEVTSRIVPSDVTRTSPPSNQPVPVSVSTPATTIDVPTDQLVPLPPLSPNVPTILPVPTARPQLVPMPTLRPILPPTARPQPVPMPTLRPMPSPVTAQPPQPAPTVAVTPTATTTSSRANSIRSFINSITLTGRSLQYPSSASAEERALLWLIDDDHLTNESNMIALHQRYALATLWFQRPTGFGRFGWATGITECDWYDVDCDWAGRLVTSLAPLGSIGGQIPADLGLLTDLTFLILSFNELTGTIPTTIASLTDLNFLGLYGNALTGTMPFCNSVSNQSFIDTLVVDCDKVSCPCCTICCPTSRDGIPAFEWC